ncbi:MAG: hypothetical protein KOO60_03785 [Gemmatimonadales bacterium]|nr:hypothetical protein [Gemmatimonadales bacterium]
MVGITPEIKKTGSGAFSGMSLRDVVFVLYRRKWAVLVTSLPIILIGGLSLFNQTGSYTASSRVVVQLVGVDLPRWDVSGRGIDYRTELSTFSNIATSLPVVEIAAEALADSISIIQELDPNLLVLDQPGNLRNFLHGGIEVLPVGESRILEFRFSSAHYRISLMAVGAVRNAFIEYHIFGQKNRKALAYYEEQTELVRAEIDSLLALRTSVHETAGYSSFEHELQYDAGQLAEARSDLATEIILRRSLEVTYNGLLESLEGDPREFPMGEDESRSYSMINWRNLVSKHEDELNSLLSVHTPESVQVLRQIELLNRTVERLMIEEMNYVKSMEISLLAAKEREKSMEENVRVLKKRNQRAPAAYQKISSLDTEIQSLRGLFEDLQGKMGEVRLSELADERVSSVLPLTEPEMMALFGGGQKFIYLLLIMVFGTATGIVVAFILEMMDHRILAPRQVEEYLKLPVFASVSKVE